MVKGIPQEMVADVRSRVAEVEAVRAQYQAASSRLNEFVLGISRGLGLMSDNIRLNPSQMTVSEPDNKPKKRKKK